MWCRICSGAPISVRIRGGRDGSRWKAKIPVGPTPDGVYTGKCLYYKKLAALSADGDTNWVLANAPGVYLHGALAEAHFFARNSERAQEELSLFCGAVNALNLADKADRTSGSPWQAFTDTGNP